MGKTICNYEDPEKILMQQAISNLGDLENFLNDNKYWFDIHDSEMVDMTIDEKCIMMDVLPFSYKWIVYGPLFDNVWVDPRDTYLRMRLTYYKPKIMSNTIDMEDIGLACIMEHENITDNRVAFKIFGDPSDDVNDRYYDIEFEYESFKWEVLGIEPPEFINTIKTKNWD